MERSTSTTVILDSGLNDNNRPTIFKALDGRRFVKTFLGGTGLSNNGRLTVKSSIGGGIRALYWVPLLVWALSAFVFTFAYLGFQKHSESSSTTAAYMGNISGDIATFRSSSIASHHHKRMAENLAEVVNYLQLTDEKQKQVTADADRARDMSNCEYPSSLDSFHLHECAIHIGRANQRKAQALAAEEPPGRIAFMFLAREAIPMEPIWKRFFEGHEEYYSLYVHSTPNFKFPNESFFYGHQIPSRKAGRFSITLVDAVRRLMAFAILDPIYGAANSWFVLACEATIPIRSFNFTYNYLMESQHSFVESFLPGNQGIQWFDRAPVEPFRREQSRKGEMWIAIQLRHALIVLEDWELYYKYKRLCKHWCASDEHYIPTLLGMKDPDGIENRTVVYVNWEEGHRASPHMHNAKDLSAEWFADIRNRTMDVDGQYHDTSHDAQVSPSGETTRSCYYNGVANSTCFLFARKVEADAVGHLESLPQEVLGY